jgi:hypothetical protein
MDFAKAVLESASSGCGAAISELRAGQGNSKRNDTERVQALLIRRARRAGGSHRVGLTSLPPTAAITERDWNVRFVPQAVIRSLCQHAGELLDQLHSDTLRRFDIETQLHL